MEFFSETLNPALDLDRLNSILTIKQLPVYCQSITSVLSDNKSDGVIYCPWGEFVVNRQAIKDGVRFSLPNCPNALCWTITSDATGADTGTDDCGSGNITIHCTINTKTHDEDFIDSIKQFVDDWAAGLSEVSP